MDDELQIEPKPEEPKPMSTPVMDIMPPPIAATEGRPYNTPLDQVSEMSADDQPADPANARTSVPKPAATKQPGSGVGLAITATVLIVLGLAVLATYAYLKTTG